VTGFTMGRGKRETETQYVRKKRWGIGSVTSTRRKSAQKGRERERHYPAKKSHRTEGGTHGEEGRKATGRGKTTRTRQAREDLDTKKRTNQGEDALKENS